MFFFIGAAIKIAVLVSWHTTLVSLSYSDDLQLEIQERSWYENVMVKMLLWMYVVLLVLNLCLIQVVISIPYWIKLTIGQLLLFFLCNFSSFFSYVRGIPVTNHFSLLLIDRYILAIQQIITHKEHLRYSF